MKITYLNHSGFSIELESLILYFDCVLEENPQPLNHHKQVYVFVTHRHADHFNPNIFTLFDGATFILYKKIKCKEIKQDIRFMIANEEQHIDDLIVSTLGSTDEGVAFIVSIYGKVIYHSGDLNWWHWEEEDKLENQGMAKRFKNKIEKIKNLTLDVAFFPTDPRQEASKFWGINYFMAHTHTLAVFPMHFWDDYSVITKLLEDEGSLEYRDKIQRIQNKNQEFIME